jgi:hypothetical protein
MIQFTHIKAFKNKKKNVKKIVLKKLINIRADIIFNKFSSFAFPNIKEKPKIVKYLKIEEGKTHT